MRSRYGNTYLALQQSTKVVHIDAEGAQRIHRRKNQNPNLYEDQHSPTSVAEFEGDSSDEYNPCDEEDDEENHALTTTKQKARWRTRYPDQWERAINKKRRSLSESYQIYKKR
ncbi:unnamed protein product [Acanthoscelides obtectus]|uniref:Uncharacterized protein n=1 Tax=Acanthoscelides obtectus TaxID=200917 RepID=A0A9P0PIK7_ACAOB|nr:unnamed protein product [Acanthoscelides obtectus]CAK1672111.1 hypothetical protein AOBTE_LOCUS28650 [Acanthoscelides obtectus]